MRILVSGSPGVGKTTLIKRLSERIVGCGFYTEEVRERGVRIGFDFVRIPEGDRIPLARVGSGSLRVGRYTVFVENVGRALQWLENCRNIVFVDEIGPMELKHPEFASRVLHISKDSRVFVGTVHRSLARRWAQMMGAELLWLTKENREEVFRNLLTSLGL